MSSFNPVELIRIKRDGGELSAAQIRALIERYVAGDVADYQMSAWLMAAYLQGLSDAETVALTEAMLHSGRVLELKTVKKPKVDKHSTGGVGDKVSICLAPLVAACGVAVPMISGRGLGHTGGTLDKLEAIDGYDVTLEPADFERIVREQGLSLIGQTEHLAPADRRIYALRDVTATVECIPLIVASILSKKLAEGIDGLVLDVKVGRGAFMKDVDSARELARALVRVGKRAGKKVRALLTDMDVPLGNAIGNALETREAIDVLMGSGPADTRELTLALGVEMLIVAGVTKSRRAARAQLEAAIASGAGLDRLAMMVAAQGGDESIVRDPNKLPATKTRVIVPARRTGWVHDIDALELGMAAVDMGAGRTRADQDVDPAVGIIIDAKPGVRVKAGDSLATLHVRGRKGASEIGERVAAAFKLSRARPDPRPLILERV